MSKKKKKNNNLEELLQETLSKLTAHLAKDLADEIIPTPLSPAGPKIKKKVLGVHEKLSYLNGRIERGIGLLTEAIKEEEPKH